MVPEAATRIPQGREWSVGRVEVVVSIVNGGGSSGSNNNNVDNVGDSGTQWGDVWR